MQPRPVCPKAVLGCFHIFISGWLSSFKEKTHALPEDGKLNCTVLTFPSARGQAGSPGAVLGAMTDQTHWGFGVISATKPDTIFLSLSVTHSHTHRKTL